MINLILGWMNALARWTSDSPDEEHLPDDPLLS
jgi:hypothetical protein